MCKSENILSRRINLEPKKGKYFLYEREYLWDEKTKKMKLISKNLSSKGSKCPILNNFPQNFVKNAQNTSSIRCAFFLILKKNSSKIWNLPF
jgi:hypothetical protein